MYAPHPFDPKVLSRYTVIRVYYKYPDEPAGEKLFVVLAHKKVDDVGAIVCLKATSKTAKYENDPEQMAGCVYYSPGECACFPQATAIQPDNPLAFAYSTLQDTAARNQYRVEGKMPDVFHNRLVAAIKNSATLKPKQQKLTLEMIGENL